MNLDTKKDLAQTLVSSPTIEENELEEERKKAEKANQEIKELDEQVALDIEKRIRQEFNEEFDCKTSNINECYEQLEEIKDELWASVYIETNDEILQLLERKIILKVFEENLISIGSSLDAYYEWEQKYCESDENSKDTESNENNSRYHI